MAWKWTLCSLAGVALFAVGGQAQQQQTPPPRIIILSNCPPPGVPRGRATTTNRIPIPLAPLAGEKSEAEKPAAAPAAKAENKKPAISSIPPAPPANGSDSASKPRPGIPPAPAKNDPAAEDRFKSIADFPIPKKSSSSPEPVDVKPAIPPETAPKPPAETPEPPVSKTEPPKVKFPMPLLKDDLIEKTEKPSSPWIVRVEVVDNQTHLYARSRDTEFRVVCKSLDMKTPKGEIRAEGNVTVNAAGFDVHCDRMAISWLNEWVVMEGSVRLETEKNGQRVQLSGNELRLKLTTLVRRAEGSDGPARILPASFAPNSGEASKFRPRESFPDETERRPETLPPPSSIRPAPQSDFQIPNYKSPLSH